MHTDICCRSLLKMSAYHVENVTLLLLTLTDTGDWERLIRFARGKEELLYQNNRIQLLPHLNLTQS